VEEGKLAARRDEQEAVGLGDGARDLGEELRAGYADGDRESDSLANCPAEPHRDLAGRPREPPHAADVQEGLVDRHPLDERRGVLEHLVDRLARVGVGGHARWHHDRVRTQEPRAPARHRRPNAAGLRLVARREDDAGAHDDRASEQVGIVPLFDRRVERVEIRVQDRRVAAHEHMFA
jgi:hypothetical protein